jgi:hypothetical protein
MSLDAALAGKALAEPPPRVENGAYRLIDPSNVIPRAVKWAWRHRIATGTLTIIAGPGGVGKGALWAELVAQLTRGQLDGDLHAVPQRVLILTAEENVSDVVAPRLHAAGADLTRARILTMRDGEYDRDVTFPDDLEHVRDALSAFGASVVVIDPLNAHLAERIDSHKDASLRRALAPLTRLAGETGCAVVGVAHTNKGFGDAVSRVLGSVAYVNAARSVLIVGTPPDVENGPERVVAFPKSNNAPAVSSLRFRLESRQVQGVLADGLPGFLDVVGVAWLGEDTATADDLLGSNEDRTLTAEAMSWLADLLTDGPRPRADIVREAHKVGITDKALRRAREALQVEVTRDDSTRGRPSVWTLPGLRARPDQETGEARNRANEQKETSDYGPTHFEGM